jgi:hypothetical protein
MAIPWEVSAIMFSKFGARIFTSRSPFDPTPEQIYYNSEEHFHEMPYRLGDRLPGDWHMHGGWPNWGRPRLVPGARACHDCAGRGGILYAHVISRDDGSWYTVLAETGCWKCCETGIDGEKNRRDMERFLRDNGYADYGEYYKAQVIRGEESRRASREAARTRKRKAHGYFASAWNAANKLFSPQHNYLHDEDSVIGWLYRARSIIGAFMLVAIGVRYHHPATDLVAPFSPVLGGVTTAMLLALAMVVPGAILAVLFTHRGKRMEACRQMRYPLGSLLACLILYMIGVRITWLMHVLVADGKSFPLVVVWMCSGFWVVTFVSRAIYLVTTGLCRLGDGHPLLPPVAGLVIAWAVAITSLLSSKGGGEPGMVAALVLLGGPVSITAVSVVETWRLRVKYPADFPFRDGPLPPRAPAVTHGYRS